MNTLQEIQDALVQQNLEVSFWGFVINLLGVAILCLLTAAFYGKYGRSLSNRAQFARNFLLIGMTTMLIITIVKSSLALSLGLVGALSIVRFRSAIKEPEELAYLFLTIAIGLGMGANQRVVTFTGFLVMMLILWVRARSKAPVDERDMVFSLRGPSGFDIKKVSAILENHCLVVGLRRFEESDVQTEALFVVELENLEHMVALKNEIRELVPGSAVALLDRGGIS